VIDRLSSLLYMRGLRRYWWLAVSEYRPSCQSEVNHEAWTLSLARFCDLVSHYLSITASLHCPPSHLAMNISGTLNVFRLIRDPTICLPQHTVSTFNHLPIPLSKAFPKKDASHGGKDADIQAVVLDKDNCFAAPHTNEIHKPYHVRLVHTNNCHQYLHAHTSSRTTSSAFDKPILGRSS
jgi:hypothetical protein